MNLALDKWLPVRRKDGSVGLVAPWEISDPQIVAIDSTRSSWSAALTEFLVSLYQTIFLPEDARNWREFWNDPPSPEYLKRELTKVSSCFDLFGKHPFLQDPSVQDDKYLKPAQKLLVDGVSDNQEKKNADLFVKSGAISTFCFPCAAAAIWDLQSHSPQGSAGYYVSLRGGGPASTLILADTLWKTVWANVVEQSSFDIKGRPDPATFLPWMKPENRKVTRSELHPLHVYWGMPRRILLKKTLGAATCDTCAAAVDESIQGFYTYRGGFRYLEAEWKHPCSPYVRTKEQAWVVRSTEGDLTGYRHWMGLLIDTPGGDGLPAFTVKRWLERSVPNEPYLRIWAYGYQTDQAAVNLWCEGKMPFLTLQNGHRKEYEKFVITLVTLSQRAVECLSDSLRGAIKSADAPSMEVNEPINAFWKATEPAFIKALRKAADQPTQEVFDAAADEWIGFVQKNAIALYESHLPRYLDPMWTARYAHKLRRRLSGRDPITLKTRKYGDWRLTDA